MSEPAVTRSAPSAASRSRRRLWILLGGTLLGTATVVGLLLTPAVQGWLVRRLVATQPGLRIDFEKLHAHPAGVEVAGLDFAMPGLQAKSAPIAIRIAPGRLLNSRELRIERVEARKLLVTLTPADLPSSPEPFAGLMQLLQSPLAWALDEADLDGEVAVRDAGQTVIVGTFAIKGGRVSATNPGAFDYELAFNSALLPPGPDNKVRSRGTVRVTQGASHNISEIVVDGTLVLPRYGPLALPAGKFSVTVSVAPNGETYVARLELGGAGKFEFTGRLDAALAQLSGRLTAHVEQSLAASSLEKELPSGVADATADVKVDLRQNDVDLTANAQLRAGDWSRLAPEFAVVDALTGRLSAVLTGRAGKLTLTQLEGSLRGEKSPVGVRLHLSNPVDLLTPPPDATLATLSIEHLPLAWANPWLARSEMVLAPGEVNAAWELGVTADRSGFTLTPERSVTVDALTLKGARLPELPAIALAFSPQIEVSRDRAWLTIEDFAATTRQGDKLSLRVAASYDFKTATARAAGELTGAIPTLLSGPDRPLPFSLSARWDASLTGRRLEVKTVELAARAEGSAAPYVALELLQPFTLELDQLTTPATSTSADWLRLRFAGFPLAWVSRWTAPRELAGTLADGESVVRSSADGRLSIVTTTPWRLSDARLGLGGKTFFAGEATIAPALAVHADRYVVDLRDISATHRDGSRIRGSIAAEAQLKEKKGSTTIAFDAELPALPHSTNTFGALFATLRAKSHNETPTIAVVDEFELRVRNRERELLALEAPAPFLAGVSGAGMFSAGTVAPLRLSTGEIPLGWLRPWLPALEADGVLQPAEFQLTAQLTKFLVRPLKPVHVRNFSARFAGRDIARDMEFSVHPGLDLTLICVPAPVFQLAYSGTAHLTNGAIDVLGQRAVDLDVAVSFMGNDQTVLPNGLEYTTRADFAQLSRVPALAGTGFPGRGSFVARLNGDMLGQAPLEFWSRLEGVPSADGKRTLPALEISAHGKVTAQQNLAADVALRFETTPRVSDLRFEAKLNLVAGNLEIASALNSEFLDVAEALALSEGLYAPAAAAVAPTEPGPSPGRGQDAPVYPQLGIPFWSHLRGYFDLNLGTVRHPPYQVDRIRGRLEVRERELVLSNLRGEMFAGRWSGGARIDYVPEDTAADHRAAGEFKIEQFDSARVVQTVFPTELASVDAKIDVQARVRSRGNALFELIDRAQADFTVEGRQGVVRLNVPKQEMAATAAVFGGTVLLSPELRALGRLMKKFAEMPVDQLRISGERTESGEVHLSEFRIDSPQARLTAHGRIPTVEGQPLMNRPLQLSIDLAAKHEMAVILGGMNLIDKKPRADGYRPLKETFELRGKAGEPDTRPLYDLLAKAVLGSKGTWGFLMRKVQEQVNKMKAPEAKRPVGP